MLVETVSKKPSLKKPKIKKNKFANMTSKDWKESNESSKRNRDINGITYNDLFGGK